MATGIILAGGASTRMPGDKAFMEVSGRRVIEIQIEVMGPLFDEILIVGNAERMKRLQVYASPGVKVVEEPVAGKGPLGGILSGLLLSGTQDNFVVACDMPFIRREAVSLVTDRLKGFQVVVPSTPGGLEPLHAAYHSSCTDVITAQLAGGNLKVSDFFASAKVSYVPWEEFLAIDPSGRLLLNVNEPEDMRAAGPRGEEQEGG
jgi:molybdopterin-guanine dinucleotide biosynthesis protein A